jgi:hypothetical protein
MHHIKMQHLYSRWKAGHFRPTPQQEEQLRLRSHEDQQSIVDGAAFMTSTRAARALGQVYGCTAVKYWEDLMFDRDTNVCDAKSQAYRDHGKRCEWQAIGLAESILKVRIHDEGLRLHPVHKWLATHHDGLVETTQESALPTLARGPGLLECKCVINQPDRRYLHLCTPRYMPQVQHEMEVCSCSYCLFARYYVPTVYDDVDQVCRPIPGAMREFHVTLVKRDTDYWNVMYKGLQDFMDCLLLVIPPTPKVVLPRVSSVTSILVGTWNVAPEISQFDDL